MHGSSEKAAHYISLLDNARVNASWTEIPELVRKVNKHAPQRKLLVDTATAEHDVATTSSNPSSIRPGTSAGNQPAALSTLSNTLQSHNEQTSEDFFQGKSCLLWSRWLGLQGQATTIGIDTATTVKAFEGRNTSTWTKICIVKSAYIEGTNYMRSGRLIEGQKVLNAALPHVQSSQDLVLSTPQLAYWTEQLLGQLAIGSDKPAESGTGGAIQMEAFKFWGTIASKTREVTSSVYGNSNTHMARLTIWKKYYQYLSAGLEVNPSLTSPTSNALRLQQSTEIRKVERGYENELLRVTKFPTATDTNAVVEQWVEQAIRNWQILCGPQWRDSELGEGGRNAIARNMLDVLYRAATKTFHSTLILRRLFQVHLSLSEFDLAYRAFDTYLELVDRGRIRVAKSKKSEPGHESDEMVLLTMAEAIGGLCKFGRQAEAQKAYRLSIRVEDWLVSIGIETGEADYGVQQNGYSNGDTVPATLDQHILQIVHRAVGVGKAHWARWTPASEDRSELQQEALSSLRKACGYGDPDMDTLYALSLLLAETRDIPSAIQAAKQALAKNTSSTQSPGWTVERKLISLWHLLALLLSSRQDYDSAAKSCMAAFEQLAPESLQLGLGRSSSVSSNIEQQTNAALSTFADELECDELQRIIEVQVTELALTELTEGPEEAVNCCNDLLSLFSRLFAHIQIPLETPSTSRTLIPPGTSAGTIKSSRMSMFGRHKPDSHTGPLNEKSEDMTSIATNTTRPSTRATQAPTIQVTNEDEKLGGGKHHVRKSYDSSHSRTTDGGSRRLSYRLSHRGHKDAGTQASDKYHSSGHVQPAPSAQTGAVSDMKQLPEPIIPLEHEESTESRQVLPKVERTVNSHNSVPPPEPHTEQPPQQDIRLPTVHPLTNATSPSPRFPKAVAQRQALAILAKVWLVIATLYRRASMFDDSKEACEEASKAATKIEAIVGTIDHSARALAEAGWGVGNRSADEVWADVYCERAELQLAMYNRQVKDGNSTSNEGLRAAVDQYEQCLMFIPNHPAGIIGLSNVLLDSYVKKVDLGRRVNDGRPQSMEQENLPKVVVSDGIRPAMNGTTPARRPNINPLDVTKYCEEDLKKTPENLNRIAARDRAYGLLSTLTKLGTGWDDSKAWFALARAHELGGEIEKAKEVLWWCVELEDTKPIRHWKNLGYSL